MSEMTIERIEKRYKKANCNHSAYKMVTICGGIFGIYWKCVRCGIIKRELEDKQ